MSSSSVPAQTPSPGALKSLANQDPIQRVERFFAARRETLDQIKDFDDFIMLQLAAEEAADASGATQESRAIAREMKAISYHIALARAEFLRVLWGEGLYLSAAVADRVIFALASDPAVTDLAGDFFAWVVGRGIHHHGFVLYPLHSFGIQGFGFAELMQGTLKSHISLPEAGVVIGAQTNDKGKTLHFLDLACTDLGINAPVPQDFQWEFQRGALKWLTLNPLMVVRISSRTSGYYENQFIIALKLRLAKALVLMLAALDGSDRSDPDAYNLSTARTNNAETLDINHYIVFEATGNGQPLIAIRTPMNLSKAELTELSDVSVDIDPIAWSRTDRKGDLDSIRSALQALENSYVADCILDRGTTTRAAVVRKMHSSIRYFSRSFRARQDDDEAAVSLAIAFELLLTDGYGRGGVKARVARRVKLCLTHRANGADLEREVQRLMERRGNVVHEGSSKIELDLNGARQAYVWCFLSVIGALHHIREGASQPVGDALGDVGIPAAPPWRAWLADQIQGVARWVQGS